MPALSLLVAPWFVTTTTPFAAGGGRVGPVAAVEFSVFIHAYNTKVTFYLDHHSFGNENHQYWFLAIYICLLSFMQFCFFKNLFSIEYMYLHFVGNEEINNKCVKSVNEEPNSI